jgi:hypothetical protein
MDLKEKNIYQYRKLLDPVQDWIIEEPL